MSAEMLIVVEAVAVATFVCAVHALRTKGMSFSRLLTFLGSLALAGWLGWQLWLRMIAHPGQTLLVLSIAVAIPAGAAFLVLWGPSLARGLNRLLFVQPPADDNKGSNDPNNTVD